MPSLGGGGSGGLGAPKPAPMSRREPVYFNTYFQHAVAVVGVFLVCFVLLIAIRPPFTYTCVKKDAGKPETTGVCKFSGGKAAVISLCVSAVAALVMFITAMVLKNQKTRA